MRAVQEYSYQGEVSDMRIYKGGNGMQAGEEQFLTTLGLSVKQFNKMPNFFIKTLKEGKVRLTFRSKFEPIIRYGDCISFVVSSEDFVNICNNLKKALYKLKKEEQEKEGR
jgi:hypothetical protein